MTSKLDQLRDMSVVVADTGDMDAIEAWRPVDCTTNPTLVLKAAQLPRYHDLVAVTRREIEMASGDADVVVAQAAHRLSVNIGTEIAKLVPGRISTEVDARLSFNVRSTVDEGRALIASYAARGIPKERILIKIAATWEGISAARILQSEGIDVNMTLVFSLAQAIACAEAGAFLISPFVGRILDFYRQSEGRDFTIDEHPGVRSVRQIHAYFVEHGFPTQVMAASFRSAAEIEALAGCDRLTIAPALIERLAQDTGPLIRQLKRDATSSAPISLRVSEQSFRWALNEDAMATAKLAEGIRVFASDLQALYRYLTPVGWRKQMLSA
jgi:transaldolase